jgi:hypothetical protein
MSRHPVVFQHLSSENPTDLMLAANHKQVNSTDEIPLALVNMSTPIPTLSFSQPRIYPTHTPAAHAVYPCIGFALCSSARVVLS